MGLFSALFKERTTKKQAQKILRDNFRKEIAKKNAVNWKRVRITNWQTKEFIIK